MHFWLYLKILAWIGDILVLCVSLAAFHMNFIGDVVLCVLLHMVDFGEEQCWFRVTLVMLVGSVSMNRPKAHLTTPIIVRGRLDRKFEAEVVLDLR
jgi:hypothetical protein